MVSRRMNTTDVRLLLPETLWLEMEYFENARAASDRLNCDEPQRWDAYLKTLALLSFEAWLEGKLPGQTIQRHRTSVDVGYLQVGEFKVWLLVTDQVLDEAVHLPRTMLESPELANHFYVVLEVLEEQEQVLIRGFLRYDELMDYYHQGHPSEPGGDTYSLPLAVFDPEVAHLVLYVRHSTPHSIPLPQGSTTPVAVPFSNLHQDLAAARTRLSQWLQGTLDQGWQAIDALVNPEASLAVSLRQVPSSTKGGKLINFGLQLGIQTVALLVTVIPEVEGKLGIGIQVLPVGGATILPPNLKLRLLSETDVVLQEVQSRAQDNYIQLKPFKGKLGTQFGIEVSIDGVQIKEAFEL